MSKQRSAKAQMGIQWGILKACHHLMQASLEGTRRERVVAQGTLLNALERYATALEAVVHEAETPRGADLHHPEEYVRDRSERLNKVLGRIEGGIYKKAED